MSLRTVNDVFFSIVRRDSPRVMLTRMNGTWKEIGAQ